MGSRIKIYIADFLSYQADTMSRILFHRQLINDFPLQWTVKTIEKGVVERIFKNVVTIGKLYCIHMTMSPAEPSSKSQ